MCQQEKNTAKWKAHVRTIACPHILVDTVEQLWPDFNFALVKLYLLIATFI